MKKLNLFFAILLGLSTFARAQHTKVGTTISRQEFLTKTNSQTIKGFWSQPKWSPYKLLHFNDSLVYINNNIDTIMPAKYKIVGDTLIIFGGQSAKPYKNKIILLRTDTLVLQGIFDDKDIHGYSKN